MRTPRFFHFYLAAALLGLAVPAQAQYRYRVQNGNAILTRYTGTGGAVVIPAQIAGRPVTELGPFLFNGNTTLTSVVVGHGVTNIGDFAFHGCSNLTRAVIGNGARRIGASAFRHCGALTNVALGNQVRRIEAYAFGDCRRLREVRLSWRLDFIGTAAFIHNVSLREFRAPNSVRTIGDLAFYGCTGLTQVWLGGRVRTVGAAAFAECRSLGSVIFGASLRRVGEGAFRNCRNLTSLYFFGNVPQFAPNLRPAANARTLRIFRHKDAANWPARVQGFRVYRFTRLPTMVLNARSRTVGHLAGRTGFWVTNSGHGQMNYRVATSDRWLTIPQGRTGVNGGRVVVAFEYNQDFPQRTGTVTVISADATNSPQTVRIVQYTRPELRTEPVRREVSQLAGATTFAIANGKPGKSMKYTAAVSNSPWLRITGGGTGTTHGVLQVAFTANSGGNARTGTVVVTAPGARLNMSDGILRVVQAGRPALAVTPAVRNPGYAGGQVQFTVTNSRPYSVITAYTASTDAPWLGIVSGGTGTLHGVLTVSAAANPDATSRTATVTVAASAGTDNSPAQVQVVQQGRPQLAVDPVYLEIPVAAGQAQFVVYNTGGGNLAYTAQVANVSTSWLTIVGGWHGSTGGTITVNYNPAFPGIQGTIEVTAPNALNSPRIITIQVQEFGAPSPAAADKTAAGGTGPTPVAVVTSDDEPPVFASGWAAVDGDPATAWTAQQAGGAYLAVEYRPELELRGLQVELAEGSPPPETPLYSRDGTSWRTLPKDLARTPVVLTYLWLVFPDDGSGAVPGVAEIRPNPAE
jgi:hypothetical protein